MTEIPNPLKLDARLGIKTDKIEPALEGIVAVVSGAGSGIGKSIAIGLPFAGAKVGVLDVSADAAKATVDWINANYGNGTAYLMVASVIDFTRLESVYKSFFSEYGRLDLIVNCAGTARPGPIDKLPQAHIDLVIDLNIKGYFYNTRVASTYMIQANNGGSIINISSASARGISSESSLYGTSKEAECMMARLWANDLGIYGIRANAILPGDLFGDLDIGIESAIWNQRYFENKAVEKGLVQRTDKRLGGESLHPEIRAMVIDHYVKRTVLKQQITYRDIVHQIIYLSGIQGQHITGESISITSGNPSAMSR